MALTNITRLRAFLGQEFLTKDDALLAALLEGASTFFENEVGRTLSVASYTDTADGNGATSWLLRSIPVVAVTSVQVNGEEIPQRATVDGSGWVLQNDILRLVGYTFTRGVANCSVTYSAGYATIPEDVQGAVCELAAMRYRQRDSIGVFSRSVTGQEQTMYQTVSLPIQIQRVIDHYRLPAVA